MKLSTRGRYGIRVLVDLSMQQNTHVSLASIADRQEVSHSYLELIAKDLKRAGYIRSIKGPKGGYSLAYNPEEIIIGEVLSLLEGDVRLTDVTPNSESVLESCIQQNVYEPLNKCLNDYLYSLTLRDIIIDDQTEVLLNHSFLI